MTGRPSIASNSSTKSFFCSGSRALSAASRSSSVSARISRSTSSRRSPRNMCSVRHRPMPWAPKRRARSASSALSALARTRRRRTRSAYAMIRCTAATSSSASSAPACMRPSKYSTTGDGTTGTSPRYTLPVEPSMETTSPSSMTVSPTVMRRRLVSTSSSSAPQTQVLPMPRATTAACEVLPPREVRMPSEAIMPSRSSGLVSRRIRMTFSPERDHLTAVYESKTALPTAAPGEAAMPRPSRVVWRPRRSAGTSAGRAGAPVTRWSASASSIRPWSTSWVAMRKAAPAVRLPTRVWSIHSWPRSMVNSMSQRSL